MQGVADWIAFSSLTISFFGLVFTVGAFYVAAREFRTGAEEARAAKALEREMINDARANETLRRAAQNDGSGDLMNHGDHLLAISLLAAYPGYRLATKTLRDQYSRLLEAEPGSVAWKNVVVTFDAVLSAIDQATAPVSPR